MNSFHDVSISDISGNYNPDKELKIHSWELSPLGGLKFTISNNLEWLRLAIVSLPPNESEWFWCDSIDYLDSRVRISITYSGFVDFLESLSVAMQPDKNLELFMTWACELLVDASKKQYISGELATTIVDSAVININGVEIKNMEFGPARAYGVLALVSKDCGASNDKKKCTNREYITDHPEDLEPMLTEMLHNWLESPVENKEDLLNE